MLRTERNLDHGRTSRRKHNRRIWHSSVWETPCCFSPSRKRTLNSELEPASIHNDTDKEKNTGVSNSTQHWTPVKERPAQLSQSTHTHSLTLSWILCWALSITILGWGQPKGYKGYAWLVDAFGQQRPGLHCPGFGFVNVTLINNNVVSQ